LKDVGAVGLDLLPNDLDENLCVGVVEDARVTEDEVEGGGTGSKPELDRFGFNAGVDFARERVNDEDEA
jgi:hypothetical protein